MEKTQVEILKALFKIFGGRAKNGFEKKKSWKK